MDYLSWPGYKRIFENNSLWVTIWWKYAPSVCITVPWPGTPIEYVAADGSIYYTVDPNEIFRHDLEKLIGKQGFAWDWKWEQDTIEIKILKGKQRSMHATLLALKWN